MKCSLGISDFLQEISSLSRSVVSLITSKYCISDSSADYEGYSIYSQGLLPTVVDLKRKGKIYPFECRVPKNSKER